MAIDFKNLPPIKELLPQTFHYQTQGGKITINKIIKEVIYIIDYPSLKKTLYCTTAMQIVFAILTIAAFFFTVIAATLKFVGILTFSFTSIYVLGCVATVVLLQITLLFFIFVILRNIKNQAKEKMLAFFENEQVIQNRQIFQNIDSKTDLENVRKCLELYGTNSSMNDPQALELVYLCIVLENHAKKHQHSYNFKKLYNIAYKEGALSQLSKKELEKLLPVFVKLCELASQKELSYKQDSFTDFSILTSIFKEKLPDYRNQESLSILFVNRLKKVVEQEFEKAEIYNELRCTLKNIPTIHYQKDEAYESSTRTELTDVSELPNDVKSSASQKPQPLHLKSQSEIPPSTPNPFKIQTTYNI